MSSRGSLDAGDPTLERPSPSGHNTHPSCHCGALGAEREAQGESEGPGVALVTPCGHPCPPDVRERLVSQESTFELCNCGQALSGFQVLNSHTELPLRPARPETIWGQNYVQNNRRVGHENFSDCAGGEGNASYHFVSPEESYILYDDKDWMHMLDDEETPLPRKKRFASTSWDPRNRVFRGSIVWAPQSLGREQIWSYSVEFSEDFEVVSGGRVHGYREAEMVDGEWVPVESSLSLDGVTRFEPPRSHAGDEAASLGNALTYFRVRPAPTSLFGLSFIQERFPGQGTAGVASYHFPREAAFMCRPSPAVKSPASPVLALFLQRLGAYEIGLLNQIRSLVVVTMPYISYSAAPPHWKLSDGTSPPARKFFKDCTWDPTTRTFTGTIDWSPLFFRTQLWHYEMTFSPDLTCIYRGQHLGRRTAEDAECSERSFFAKRLFYYRDDLVENTPRFVEDIN